MGLKLEVVPVESLLPHEATIPHIVKKLLLEFTNLAKLQNPVIIDENDILRWQSSCLCFQKIAIQIYFGV
jgi:hypothetical protein